MCSIKACYIKDEWVWRSTERLRTVKGHDIESVKDMQRGRVWKDWGSGKGCMWECGWTGFVVTTMLDQLWPKLEEVYKSWPLGEMQGAELEFGGCGLDTNMSYRTCGMRYGRVQWSELKSESWKSEIIILKILMIRTGVYKWLTNSSFNFNGFWFLWEVTHSRSIDSSYSENISLVSGQAMTDKPAWTQMNRY